MTRKSPIQHKVKSHKRRGRVVHSFVRGRGLTRWGKTREKPVLPKIEYLKRTVTDLERLRESNLEIASILARGEIPDMARISRKYNVSQGSEIDKEIFPALVKLNRHGLRTLGSCGGHVYDGHYSPPFMTIEFDNKEKLSMVNARLNSLVRHGEVAVTCADAHPLLPFDKPWLGIAIFGKTREEMDRNIAKVTDVILTGTPTVGSYNVDIVSSERRYSCKDGHVFQKGDKIFKRGSEKICRVCGGQLS